MEGEAYVTGKARLRDLLGKPVVSRVSEGAWLQPLKGPPRASDSLVPGCLYLWGSLSSLSKHSAAQGIGGLLWYGDM